MALLSKAVVDIALNDGPLTAYHLGGIWPSGWCCVEGRLSSGIRLMRGIAQVVAGDDRDWCSWPSVWVMWCWARVSGVQLGRLVMALAVVTMVLSTFALSRRFVG